MQRSVGLFSATCAAAATFCSLGGAQLGAVGEDCGHQTAIGAVILGRLHGDGYLIPRLEGILAKTLGIDGARSLRFGDPLDHFAVVLP